MDMLQVLSLAFGGSAAALAIAAFLGKTLISQFMAREMETLKARLQQDARADDRQFQLAQVMRRYQGPLLHAAYDLQSRLYNILARQFFSAYLDGGTATQKHYAQHNTAFLIAQFFGWMEIIRQEVQFIEFSDSKHTRRLSDLRDEIYRLWQTDRLAQAVLASGKAAGTAHDRLRAIQHKLIEMLEVLDPNGLRFRAEARTRA